MPRYVFGPGHEELIVRSDAPVVLSGVDADGTVRVTFPNVSCPLVVLPERVHAVLLEGPPAPGVSAEEVLNSATRKGSLRVTAPGAYGVKVANLVAGKHWVQVIVEYGS